jgi:hypothetical protein
MRLAFISGVTAMSVDIAIQRMRRSPYDYKRTARVASYAFVSAFPQNAYFKNLGRVCKNPIEKTMMNQFVFAPINIAAGIAWNLALQSKFQEIVPTVQKNILPGLVEGSLYWCPLNVIGFSMMRPAHHFIFFKLAGIPYKFMFVKRTN